MEGGGKRLGERSRRLVSEVHELLSDNKPDGEANCSEKNQRRRGVTDRTSRLEYLQKNLALVEQFSQTDGLKFRSCFVLLFQTRCKVLVSSSWPGQRCWYVCSIYCWLHKDSKAASDSRHICACRPSRQARKCHISGKRLSLEFFKTETLRLRLFFLSSSPSSSLTLVFLLYVRNYVNIPLPLL